MTLAPFQLALDGLADQVRPALALPEHGVHPFERPFGKPGDHILGPKPCASHGDYFSYEVLTARPISHMTYGPSRERPMNPATAALIAAKKAERAATGLKVTLSDTGWVGHFATVESRDEFVERARRQGRRVEIEGVR